MSKRRSGRCGNTDTNRISEIDIFKASVSTPYDIRFSVPAPFEQPGEFSDSDHHPLSSDSEGIFVHSLNCSIL